ncbi:hypothetical protein CVT24_005165 [Panaeolus cyanescens]|uniref:RING-type domain-containing protein n=1 Tax=Panaeolus cyanescens TaxID=181874 RepID=A0A409Y930_9AGAR|nr:hypothetical protein CVT24_005165 [Panaeolus cyanescens]
MRNSQSFHECSAWSHTVSYDRSKHLDLNANAFLTLVTSATNAITEETPEDTTDVNEHGKRKAREQPARGRTTSKRLKSSVNADTSSSRGFPTRSYPMLSPTANAEMWGSAWTSSPFSHELTIQYSTKDMDNHVRGVDAETAAQWKEKVGDLRGTLKSLSESEPTVIELGAVMFGSSFDQGVIALSHKDSHPALESNTWLFRIPSLEVSAENKDLHEDARDLIYSFQQLQRHGQVLLDSTLRMQVHPTEDDDVLPFSLHLTISVSIIFPNIKISPNHVAFTSKKDMVPVEDARRRVLRWACIEDELQTDDNQHNISIADFYGIMQPASALPSPDANVFLQPLGLLPSLLPFQKRSLAWLLMREGVNLNTDGQLVTNPDYRGFSFWNEIEERNQKWYINRLTDEFTDTPPPPPNGALGGILAEEPGLGKTLETIALILMNPAPPEWNPSVSRWDASSRLDIKAVKTSLIVTPPALAGQWKDELEAHAPSLKVLVYEGWGKIPVPMTKEKAEIERFEHKLKTTQAAKPKAKKRKSKAGAEVPEEESEPDPISTKDADGKWLEWCQYVHQFDVVITTFPVLRSEVWVARAPPERSRREAAAYSGVARLRSPLVMVEWKRVVMDEVQMVGGGQAAEMVSLIPRLSSFAVSGTPAKSQVADLIHVLRFLRVDDIIGSNRAWQRLLKPGYAKDFTEFLQFYGIRTVKSIISDELTIPQQTRYLVPIEMGRVERHVYDQTLETILLDLGLDARGVAANDGWTVDGALLRSSIRRLRGICTHPQVGQLQRRGDNLMKPGALKTMEAVLEAMTDQNWRSIMDAWRNKILSLVRLAQLQQQVDDDDERYQHMLETLQATEKEMKQQVDELQTALALHDEKGKLLKQEAVKHLKAVQDSSEGQDNQDTESAAAAANTGGSDRNGKGKAKAVADDSEGSDDEDENEDDLETRGLPKNLAGEEHRTKRSALSNRLRDAKVLLHRIIFLEGDALHGLGRSKEEDEKYSEAERIRRDLLKFTEKNAAGALAIVTSNAVRKGLKISRMLVPLPFLVGGGIKSYYMMEEMNTVIEQVLNAQSTLLWEWRGHIVELLSRPVSPGEGDADGQEYQRTLDDQGEAEAYLQAYTALFSDRRLALVNERALLAAHDIKEKQARKTMAAAAARAAAALEEENFRRENGITEGEVELNPEHEVLHKNLSDKRKVILTKLNKRSVKSIMIDLQNAYANTYPDTNPERVIIADAVNNIRKLLHEQNELHNEIEMDLSNLRKAFNQRIVYFRQLQEISDSVMDVDWDGTLQKAMQDTILERAAVESDLKRLRARQRYLGTLTSDKKDDESQEDEDKTCVLCRCDFVRGFITHCAHIFCEECMRAWLVRKEGKTCPVCRVAIDSRSVQRFTVNASAVEPPPRPTLPNGEAAPKSHRKLEYNFINPSALADIQLMETYGDYGSKIQTLMRHLTYIKAREPGAKSIIFSAWADSLHIVEMALLHNNIPSLRIEQNSKHESAVHKFRTDPNILVLLLHGERENAGLNVICASRVFLLESVVQHSFEVQAIARIDRLGQTRPTEVYCYYAEDTIERNILDLAARKGLSLYTKNNAFGTLNISPFATEGENKIDEPQKKGKQKALKGDFIHKVDDMLAILFPHMYEDLEHLLPADALVVNGDVEMRDSFDAPSTETSQPPDTNVNAVAGPSRLRD